MSRNAPRSFAPPLGLAAALVGARRLAWRAAPSPRSTRRSWRRVPTRRCTCCCRRRSSRSTSPPSTCAFDRPTQARFAELARGQQYSYPLDAQLASAAIAAPHAVVQMQFVRDVPLNRWIGVVRDNLELAREAGLITRDIEQKVGNAHPAVVRAARGARISRRTTG